MAPDARRSVPHEYQAHARCLIPGLGRLTHKARRLAGSGAVRLEAFGPVRVTAAVEADAERAHCTSWSVLTPDPSGKRVPGELDARASPTTTPRRCDAHDGDRADVLLHSPSFRARQTRITQLPSNSTSRIAFRPVRAPVPPITEEFTLTEQDSTTSLEHSGELSTDSAAGGQWRADREAVAWEAAVRWREDRQMERAGRYRSLEMRTDRPSSSQQRIRQGSARSKKNRARRRPLTGQAARPQVRLQHQLGKQPSVSPRRAAPADTHLVPDDRATRLGHDRISAAASHSISAVLPEPPSTMLPPACAFDPPLQCRTVILPADSGRDSHEER